MAKYQLLLPKMGESVAEATVIKWHKVPGDYIEADEAVMDIATDKVDSEVPSPVSGKLVEQLYKEDDVVQVGAVIAIIETEGDESQPETDTAVEGNQKSATEAVEKQYTPSTQDEEMPAANIPGIDQLTNTEKQESSGDKFENRFYSPLVKNIAGQEGISNDELDRIPGTGAEGRLTKDDLLAYIQQRGSKFTEEHVYTAPVSTQQLQTPVAETKAPSTEKAVPVSTPQQPAPEIAKPAQPEAPAAKPAVSYSGNDEIIEMDRMRRLIADHMVMSKQTSPHVTSFVEADVTNLVQWRDKVKNTFEKREGEKITFTPIFIEAVVEAIKQMPLINVQVNGTQIIRKKDINISMATALPSGNLIVPVIKKADELSLVGLTKAVNDLANRARGNKLNPDDVKDGTFTITNIGSFGNIMGTPIINQPQVAILAVGAIKKKPAVIETPQGDAIAIRHMMYLSLSYDHRVVDGALGGMFVKKVADYLENWDLSRNI
ncbi:2-oxo acid dehydrogenase subunit E2 [Mucilaginibacter pallidiroseus]|uniref:Dihydrolipoamide acetyltransferase component of pyruvate dehydrogenase complex n=1 Tax=Mucilaginibacter pallidiroseus TaxID=2599295 RepID=A0A563UIQ4_9SPHI|nr:dihydrolipoamide acetyltransferase family protein [Mucilaginibacter pallidiroseus]TWR31245.1 2-oxo acid dehydrogenase subunit E2 [Mucilaginibacter pallidiroseus]